jgi:hypothetical protein
MKLRTFSVIGNCRGVNLEIFCTTNNEKKFAKLLNKPVSELYIKEHDSTYNKHIKKSNKLYAKPGEKGECEFIFISDEIKEIDEYLKIIDKHREKYPSVAEYYKAHSLYFYSDMEINDELFEKLLKETEPLKEDFLKKTKDFATNIYNENESRLLWRVEEWCKFLEVEPEYTERKANKDGKLQIVSVASYPKGFHNTDKAKTLDNTLKQVHKIKGYSREQFIEKEMQDAEKHYINSIYKLIFRIKDYNLDDSKIELETSYIDQNISTTITDGNRTLRAFTVLAWGDVQRPHYRYLIKLKK